MSIYIGVINFVISCLLAYLFIGRRQQMNELKQKNESLLAERAKLLSDIDDLVSENMKLHREINRG